VDRAATKLLQPTPGCVVAAQRQQTLQVCL
jgi:hypothetical protein